MKDLLNFIFKLAVSILILIILEAIGTLGLAFKFELYHPIVWVIQACLVIIAIKVASLDWNKME